MNIDMQNPWHKVNIGGHAPEELNAIIELSLIHI